MDYAELRRQAKIAKAIYPKGTRVKAVFIDDKNAPPKGMEGVVTHVDDIGTVFVHWDEPGYVSGAVVVDGPDKLAIVYDEEEK